MEILKKFDARSGRVVKDLTGHRFGKLIALYRQFRQLPAQDRRRTGWIVRCDCGRKKWVATTNLTNGGTTACGVCNIQKPGMAFRQLIHNYSGGARRRGYKFLLSDDDCRKLFSENCYYCGAKPSNVAKAHWQVDPEKFIYQGIDRKINDDDYTLENCVPCCYECNKAKLDRDDEQFLSHCERVAQYTACEILKSIAWG